MSVVYLINETVKEYFAIIQKNKGIGDVIGECCSEYQTRLLENVVNEFAQELESPNLTAIVKAIVFFYFNDVIIRYQKVDDQYSGLLTMEEVLQNKTSNFRQEFYRISILFLIDKASKNFFGIYYEKGIKTNWVNKEGKTYRMTKKEYEDVTETCCSPSQKMFLLKIIAKYLNKILFFGKRPNGIYLRLIVEAIMYNYFHNVIIETQYNSLLIKNNIVKQAVNEMNLSSKFGKQYKKLFIEMSAIFIKGEAQQYVDVRRSLLGFNVEAEPFKDEFNYDFKEIYKIYKKNKTSKQNGDQKKSNSSRKKSQSSDQKKPISPRKKSQSSDHINPNNSRKKSQSSTKEWSS